MLYPEAEFIRGPFVDKTFRPDAEMLVSNRKYWIELDTGKVRNLKQLQRRFQIYEKSDSLNLWVVLTLERVDKLRSLCGLETARFAVLSELMEDPYGDVWEDVAGDMYSIELDQEDGRRNS